MSRRVTWSNDLQAVRCDHDEVVAPIAAPIRWERRRCERRWRMAFERLISVDRLNPEKGTFVVRGLHELAVFLLDRAERVMVLDNACPHASGNLSGGTVADGAVTCPWHDWSFDLATGICTHSDRARVTTYPAEIRESEVWVDLNAAESCCPGGRSIPC